MAPPSSPEPIAIISSSCRFAGDITTPEQLWDVLSRPTDLSKEVPRARFAAEAFYHPDGSHHGTTNATRAYWLEQDYRAFDASFFQINSREAEAMDPQQRMVLEVVSEAMASAGYRMQQYAGKDVAVFVGVMTADYDMLCRRDELQTSQYHATGNARSMIANRVSHFFDFRGPSMAIDTACSSSLVAVHQAVQSLRSGESIMACVAGVNLMLTPDHFIVESDMHMLSPSGHCHMWDSRADGYARGEGVAAVLLKTLSQAIMDGDSILAIIRGTGVNSDGRTEGITTPSIDSQAELIRNTYRRAGLQTLQLQDRCQYFEAHGTGTVVGDPREAAAIKQAFYGDKAEPIDDKMLVGSVKTVIGHTEGAAGLAGLLKVVEAIRHGVVPPNLHMERPSKSVRPHLSHLEVPTELRHWPRVADGQPRRASVNSFGFGGTNAHVIVDSAPVISADLRAWATSLHRTGRRREEEDIDMDIDGNVGDVDGDVEGSNVVGHRAFGTVQVPLTGLRAVPLCISAASPGALADVARARTMASCSMPFLLLLISGCSPRTLPPTVMRCPTAWYSL